MHIFELISKAGGALGRDAGKEHVRYAVDRRAGVTYVTVCTGPHTVVSIEWDAFEGDEEDWVRFIDNGFIKVASKKAYKTVFDHEDMFVEEDHVFNSDVAWFKRIFYAPLDEMSTLSDVERFAQLSAMKGLKKQLEHRENLSSAFAADDKRVFTTGHWIYQKDSEDEAALRMPLVFLDIARRWRGKVEWLFGTYDAEHVQFHGLSEGMSVTVRCSRPTEKTPNTSAIQELFNPSQRLSVDVDALYDFITEIGKSHKTDSLVWFEWSAEVPNVATLSLEVVEVTPDNKSVVRCHHTEVPVVAYVDDEQESRTARWSAVYLMTCLGALSLEEFIVPAEDRKPCVLIGESAEALVMPKL